MPDRAGTKRIESMNKRIGKGIQEIKSLKMTATEKQAVLERVLNTAANESATQAPVASPLLLDHELPVRKNGVVLPAALRLRKRRREKGF